MELYIKERVHFDIFSLYNNGVNISDHTLVLGGLVFFSKGKLSMVKNMAYRKRSCRDKIVQRCSYKGFMYLYMICKKVKHAFMQVVEGQITYVQNL